MTVVILGQGDITTQKVDAIVNAANKSLLGGGGVDGAIHNVAGQQLFEECKTLGGCRTGEAKITKGYTLPAKYVIHTVGPQYGRENGKEAELLASCYANSLSLAKKYGIKTIAFPAISTGVFGYPHEEAARIVHEAVADFLRNDEFLTEIRFILHSDEDYHFYEKYWKIKLVRTL